MWLSCRVLSCHAGSIGFHVCTTKHSAVVHTFTPTTGMQEAGDNKFKIILSEEFYANRVYIRLGLTITTTITTTFPGLKVEDLIIKYPEWFPHRIVSWEGMQ